VELAFRALAWGYRLFDSEQSRLSREEKAKLSAFGLIGRAPDARILGLGRSITGSLPLGAAH